MVTFPTNLEPHLYAMLDAIELYLTSQDLPSIPALDIGFGYAHEWIAFPARCCTSEFVRSVGEVIEEVYRKDTEALQRCCTEIIHRLSKVEIGTLSSPFVTSHGLWQLLSFASSTAEVLFHSGTCTLYRIGWTVVSATAAIPGAALDASRIAQYAPSLQSMDLFAARCLP